MTTVEEDLRAALRAQARALRVPERPALERGIVTFRRRPGPRWLTAAACLALIAASVIALALREADDPEPAPPVASVVSDTGPEPAEVSPSPFLGSWVSTDIFGNTSTMAIEASDDDSVEMLVTDFAQVCSGSSTMTGSGRFQADSELVFPAPVLTCDDGSRAQSMSRLPLDEELRNLTFSRDPVTDIVTDNFGSVWTREGADPSREPTMPPPDAAVAELLNDFLEARVAGDGAQQYLNVPDDDVPLLYTTTSGAPYERAEFEQVPGIEWPYGLTAFRVRLFAADTVVEQLFFTPAAGRLGLEYEPNSFGTDIAPTTEDGQSVSIPESRNLFDGEVTVQAAYPWIFSDPGLFGYGRLIPQGPGVAPTTDGGERNDWDELFLIADPAPVETSCRTDASAADAEALAQSIRSEPNFGATAPVTVNVSGIPALMMDVRIPVGTTVCAPENFGHDLLSLVSDRDASGRATGELMRLYLFDVPEGSSVRVLAIAIVAPESSFERAVQAAAPVVDSIEFHAP